MGRPCAFSLASHIVQGPMGASFQTLIKTQLIKYLIGVLRVKFHLQNNMQFIQVCFLNMYLHIAVFLEFAISFTLVAQTVDHTGPRINWGFPSVPEM
jgi:hypothetical protein